MAALKKSYTDGFAYCEAAGQTVTLRCSVQGVVVCRGPENTRRYWKKCTFNADDSCAATMMTDKMRGKIIEPKQEPAPPPKPAAIREINGFCKGISEAVVISIHPGGMVWCSVKGCEQRQDILCPTRRLDEAVKEIIGTKVKLKKMRLTPEERSDAIERAYARIQAIESLQMGPLEASG